MIALDIAFYAWLIRSIYVTGVCNDRPNID